jgi:hypothetical protein
MFLGFKYLIGATTNCWHITFWTQTGNVYESSLGFSCNITAKDHGKATLGKVKVGMTFAIPYILSITDFI